MKGGISLINTAFWTTLFVVPGYITSRIKHFWLLTDARNNNDIVLESVIWSFVIYCGLSFMPKIIFDLEAFSNFLLKESQTLGHIFYSHFFLRNYLLIILFSVLIGFLYGRFFPSGLGAKFLGRTPYSSVWQEFFLYKADSAHKNGLLVEMKDGSRYIGSLKSAADNPNFAEIWLGDVRKYENGMVYLTPFSDMLVDCNEVSGIFLIRDRYN